jgi:ribosomal protein S18 acetylase RimI-like enzyme
MARNAVPTVSLPKSQVQSSGVTTRPACPDDRAWLVPLSARLFEFGPPPWRSRDSMYLAVGRSLERVVCEPSSDAEIVVAEDAHREPLGFVSLQTATDFTGEIHSHITDLVVCSIAEGRGVATALLRQAESWAMARGHRLLTLNVFPDNNRARNLYERAGFLSDMMKLLKELAPGGIERTLR